MYGVWGVHTHSTTVAPAQGVGFWRKRWSEGGGKGGIEGGGGAWAMVLVWGLGFGVCTPTPKPVAPAYRGTSLIRKCPPPLGPP
jgi:hypothetical protein